MLLEKLQWPKPEIIISTQEQEGEPFFFN